MTDDEWMRITTAYAMVETTSTYLATRPQDYDLTPGDLDGVRQTHNAVDQGFDAIEPYAVAGAPVAL